MDASRLHIQEATPEQRRQAFANVFEVWPQAAELHEHVQRRLESVQHRRARWFVGVLDGRVVTSLGAYPVRLLVDGQSFPAVAIGSVHTLSEFRGRGLASRLLAQVEATLQNEGVRLALLYSDIAPRFYERLGYLLCPSWQGWIEPHRLESRTDVAPLELQPVSWQQAAPAIVEFYRNDHARRPLAYERPQEYWEFLYRKWPQDQFLLACEQGQPVGYARIHLAGEWAHLVDWALAPAVRSGGLARLLAGLARFGSGLRWRQLGGWLPREDALAGLVELEPRQREITMVKPLDDSLALQEQHLHAAQWFLEVDHV